MPDAAGNSTFSDRKGGGSPIKRVSPAKAENKAVTSVDDTKSIDEFHVGGGWYELPNGEKVRGEDAAREALNG